MELDPEEMKDANEEIIAVGIVKKAQNAYDRRVSDVAAEILEHEERRAMLIAIDGRWQEHLADMDELREGVYLRSQGQKDPLVEYKNEAYGLFTELMESIKQDAMEHLIRSAAALETHFGSHPTPH